MHKSIYEKIHSRDEMKKRASMKKRAPTTKEKMQALENDFCQWLADNRSLSYEQRNREIIASFTEHNLSPELVIALASHMLIRMDNAHRVIEGERKFEPLIKIGYKNIRNLGGGRKKGTEKIKKQSDKKREKLKKAIKDIITHPDARLKYRQNKDVANYLHKNGWRSKYQSLQYFKKLVGEIIAELESETQ